MRRDTPLRPVSQLLSALFLEDIASSGVLPPLTSHSVISQASKEVITKIV